MFYDTEWIATVDLTIADKTERFIWPKYDPSLSDSKFIGGLNIIVDDWSNSHKEKYFKYLKKSTVCIQAGGNCGLYPYLLAQVFGVVYTFEPHPLYFHCLVNNNQKNNVIKMNAGLSFSHAMISLKKPHENSISIGEDVSFLVDGNATPAFMIDDLPVKDCDLICLDMEGGELDALIGGTNIIETFHPVITCENGGEKVIDFLKNFGYKIVDQSRMDVIYVAD